MILTQLIGESIRDGLRTARDFGITLVVSRKYVILSAVETTLYVHIVDAAQEKNIVLELGDTSGWRTCVVDTFPRVFCFRKYSASLHFQHAGSTCYLLHLDLRSEMYVFVASHDVLGPVNSRI